MRYFEKKTLMRLSGYEAVLGLSLDEVAVNTGSYCDNGRRLVFCYLVLSTTFFSADRLITENIHIWYRCEWGAVLSCWGNHGWENRDRCD